MREVAFCAVLSGRGWQWPWFVILGDTQPPPKSVNASWRMGSGICCECRRSEAQRDPLLSGGRNSLGPRPQSDRNSLIPAVLDRTHPSHIENTWKKNIEATWALKASKTAASTDIPRLVRKFELIDQKGLNITPSTTAPATIPPRSDQKASPTLIDDPRTREDEIVVLNFLLALAAALKDEDTYKHLEAHFWDFFPYVILSLKLIRRARNAALRKNVLACLNCH